MGTIYENEAPVERVILVAISERDGDDTVASLEELAELAATAGAEVVGTVIQNLFIKGKTEYELKIRLSL